MTKLLTEITPEARHHVVMFSAGDLTGSLQPIFSRGPSVYKPEVDAFHIDNLAIFRSGKFMDSMGFEHEYETIHMQQMVANFSFLRDSNIFVDVPVRAGHMSFLSNGMDDLIGYFKTLEVKEGIANPTDGQIYSYLFAGIEILDDEAAGKIEKGLWRNRSSEVGFFFSNSGAEFWPVMAGLAYVDIPAVQGLNFSAYTGAGTEYSILTDSKEQIQMGDDDKTPVPPAPPVLPVPMATFEFSLKTGKTKDFAAVQAYIVSLETANADLETFAAETKATERTNFVSSLVTDNKITALDETGLQELTSTYTDDQWKKFRALYENAPVLALLSPHAVTDGSHGTPPPQVTPEDEAIRHNLAVYARHVSMGTPEAQLKTLPSYKFLEAKGKLPV
jgi:hypothetical protein